MTQRKRFIGTIGLGVLVIAVLVTISACTNKPNPPKLGYSTDLKELRDRFNRDQGKVRLLLILSPT